MEGSGRRAPPTKQAHHSGWSPDRRQLQEHSHCPRQTHSVGDSSKRPAAERWGSAALTDEEGMPGPAPLLLRAAGRVRPPRADLPSGCSSACAPLRWTGPGVCPGGLTQCRDRRACREAAGCASWPGIWKETRDLSHFRRRPHPHAPA
eukprot:104839-Chlamydomonas_euryale.AAC.1